MNDARTADGWMNPVLLLAAAHNILWGLWVVLFPIHSLQICGYAEPVTYIEFWQCIGMIVGVYGIGYAIAAFDPFRHWPIVLVGLLGKVFGPLGFYYSWVDGSLPISAGRVIIFNDLIWWVPFTVILWRAFRFHHVGSTTKGTTLNFEDAIRSFRSQTGQTIAELSGQQRLMVIFLRHAGCTFCREALGEIQTHRSEIETSGVQIAFVHMEPEANAKPFFEKYQVGDVPRFSDPDQILYQAFDVGLGKFHQLLGFKVFWKGFLTAIVKGHGFNRVKGNMFRMPGAYILENGRIIDHYEYQNAADRPDYTQFVCQIPTSDSAKESIDASSHN